MSHNWNEIIVEIKSKIKNYLPKSLSIPFLKPAAVLLLFHYKNDSLYLIMTQRSKNLKHHNGEMSFPGGKYDGSQDEGLLQTALRETAEEIGLNPEKIEIWGRIDDLPTLTGYIIRPFIGFVESNGISLNFEKNQTEVEEIVEIPFDFLLNLPKFEEIPFRSHNQEFHTLSVIYHDLENNQNYNIWGASAHILANFFRITFNQEKYSKKYYRPSLMDIYQAYGQNFDSDDLKK